MIGSNTLLLNESTMIEAVQYWLRSNMVGSVVKVTSVKQAETHPCYIFEVVFEPEVLRNG